MAERRRESYDKSHNCSAKLPRRKKQDEKRVSPTTINEYSDGVKQLENSGSDTSDILM